jgi:hypothetical protein
VRPLVAALLAEEARRKERERMNSGHTATPHWYPSCATLARMGRRLHSHREEAALQSLPRTVGKVGHRQKQLAAAEVLLPGMLEEVHTAK